MGKVPHEVRGKSRKNRSQRGFFQRYEGHEPCQF